MFLYFQLFVQKKERLHLWLALLFSVYLVDELYYSSLEFIKALPVLYQEFPIFNRVFLLVLNMILLICYRMILACLLHVLPSKKERGLMALYSFFRLGVTFLLFFTAIPQWASVCLITINFLPHIWMIYLSFRYAERTESNLSPAICMLLKSSVVLWSFLCFGCSYSFYFGNRSGVRIVFIEIISGIGIFFAIWHLLCVSRSRKKENSMSVLSEADLEALFAKQYKLTPREMEIFRYLMEGADNAEICEKAVISQSTTKTHIYNIFRKVDIKRRSQAAGKFLEFCREYTQGHPL